MRESLNIDAGTAKEYLILFFEMDKDRDGKLSLEVRHWSAIGRTVSRRIPRDGRFWCVTFPCRDRAGHVGLVHTEARSIFEACHQLVAGTFDPAESRRETNFFPKDAFRRKVDRRFCSFVFFVRFSRENIQRFCGNP